MKAQIQNYSELLSSAVKASVLAGKEIMHQYINGFQTSIKEDESPVTTADLKAHEIICDALEQSGIPVLSEEGEKFTHEFRQNNSYWCIDPIDGTKDFVNKTDEFCVSVGLINDCTSKLGVLYAPALELLYFAAEGVGSFKFSGNRIEAEKIVSEGNNLLDNFINNSESLPTKNLPSNYTFLTSRFHRDEKTNVYIENLRKKHPNLDVITVGCAIKLGLMAESKAHEYTRFMNVNFWDLAGGHAIAKYAGLKVLNPENLSEITYTDSEMKIRGYGLKW